VSTHDGVVRSQPGVPDPGALSREYLEGYLVLPLAIADGRPRVAVAGTPDPQALDDLARLFDAIPEVVAVEEERLRDAIRRALDQSPSVLELVDAPDNGLERDETGQELLADARDLATQPRLCAT
jgi:hypothetical protein